MLLGFVLLFDAVVYTLLVGLSYGISDPSSGAEVR